MYDIILFYMYTDIADPEALALIERERTKRLGLTGRMIIAGEGINGTYEGTKENIEIYCRELSSDSRFKNIKFKKSQGTGNAFPKCSIKVRPEIVSAHLKEEDINPRLLTGKYLPPEELKKWYEQDEDFVVVDMRNDFEFASGHFKNAVPSGMKNFRDLKKITSDLKRLKNKKVLTVCTGGVRCEKASGYLISQGFENVYQLDGGIVSYMEKYPSQDFLGSLYVFDNRITMDFDTDQTSHVTVGRCLRCNRPSESYVNCENDVCHVHYILCVECQKEGSLCSDCKKARVEIAGH